MAAKKVSLAATAVKVPNERANFTKLLAANPNHFGNIVGSVFKPAVQIIKNTTYEEVTCVGFNPETNVLEAVIQVKLATGYAGNLCTSGSYEYVRFFLDYGSGFEDVGLAAVNVHDIPITNDCEKKADRPLSYAVSVTVQPKRNWCGTPVLPKARAILSWQSIPTAGDPNYSPVWGNHLDCHIQIKPRPILFEEVSASFLAEAKKVLPPEQVSAVAKIPVPLPDPPPLAIADLAKLYSTQTAKSAVPSHRFGFAHLAQVMKAPGLGAETINTAMSQWKAAGLDWQVAINAILGLSADVSFEQLECLGLEGDSGLERLVATFRIKRPSGYSGGLCTHGSTEYVAFWADWDDTCTYTYLGTVPVQVHDISTIPPDGLCYDAVLPVDVSAHRAPCNKPKIARVRAVLSWAAPPSTTDPNALNTWGNIVDTHVQIKPGDVPNPLSPKIAILGGIPTSQIGGSGLTTAAAHFAGNNLPADSLGRPCPFGGIVEVQGLSFPGFKYRVQVQPVGGGPWQNVTGDLMLTRWDGTTFISSADVNGFYFYQQFQNNIENLLANWGTSIANGDVQWRVKLEIADFFDNPILGAVPDIHVIQLDNTAPQASVNIDPTIGGDCGKFAVGAKLKGNFIARDVNFGSFSLGTLPFASPITPSGGTVQTAPAPGDTWNLDTAGMKSCGYVIDLNVADRSIVNSSWGAHNWGFASVGFCLLDKL